jgi:DNA replication factor GINS
VNLDELRTVQNKERQKDSLQHLRESFYEDVADYVADLEDERDCLAADAEDPFASTEVRQLTDEIETAREVAEAVYERRLGKLVKRASLAAADMPTDAEGLTAEERELFDDIVERIERNKSRVLEVVDGANVDAVRDGPNTDSAGATASEAMGTGGTAEDERSSIDRPPTGGPDGNDSTAREEGPPDTGSPATGDDNPAPSDADARASGGGGDAAGPAGGTGADGTRGPGAGEDEAAFDVGLDDRTTVRITDDVGEIFGVDDRDYDLSADDVVTLPAANAEPLLERDAAERIE